MNCVFQIQQQTLSVSVLTLSSCLHYVYPSIQQCHYHVSHVCWTRSGFRGGWNW